MEVNKNSIIILLKKLHDYSLGNRTSLYSQAIQDCISVVEDDNIQFIIKRDEEVKKSRSKK